MKTKSLFVISEFTNPSGKIVWRVAGWLDGKRIRKNFATRVEAEAERQILEVQRLQTETGIRTAATRLDDAQLKEAEAAFNRLAGQARSLSFYLDFALTNYREPEKQKPRSEAVAAYIASKEHEFAQDKLSPPQMGRIRLVLKRLVAYYSTVFGPIGSVRRPWRKSDMAVAGRDRRCINWRLASAQPRG